MTAWRKVVGDLFRPTASPPADEVPAVVAEAHKELAAPPSSVDARYAAAVVDLALRVASLAIQTGALTSDATAFALTVTSAYGLEVDVDVTWTSVTISYHRRGRAEPITGFRGVRQRITDYTLLTRLLRLIDEIGERELELDEARRRLDALRQEGRPYRGWVIAFGQALTGGGVAALLGGHMTEILLAALANALLYVVQYALSRTALSVFFIQAFGAAVPTAMAVMVMQARVDGVQWLANVSPSLIVASGIVSLLAGIGFVGAARDAMDGNLITASARTFDAVLQTAGIVLGVVITLWAGLALGVEGYLTPTTTGYAIPSATQIIWASLIAIGVAFSFQVSLGVLPYCAGLAAIGFATYLAILPVIGNWPGAAAVGAVVVGFLAQFIVGRFRIPLIALVTTGIVAMVPGLALYRGLYRAMESFDEPLSVQAQTNLGEATMVALALAAGSTFGAQIARPVGLPAAELFRKAAQSTAMRSRRRVPGTETAGQWGDQAVGDDE